MKRKSILNRWLAIVLVLGLIVQIISGHSISVQADEGELSVHTLKTDYTVNPTGIDNLTPAFSWQISSAQRNVMQESYHIMVAGSQKELAEGNYIWEHSDDTDEAVDIIYDGPALQSRGCYYWKVAVTDNKGNKAVSDENAFFEMGLLDAGDWEATWIQLGEAEMPSPEKYTIELDFQIVNDNAGFIFAGRDTQNYLMWQINTVYGETRFRPHQWVNGGAECLEEIDISHIIPKDKQFDSYHLTIQVDGTEITTWIGENQEYQIYQKHNPNAAYGKIGFRHSKNNEHEIADYDNIIVYDGNGNILFEEDFTDPLNPNFNFGEIIDGRLRVENVTALQSDVTGAPMYRKEFDVASGVKKATVYATALGIYELEINGEPVSDDYFNPGWTNYEYNTDDNNYVMYQTFDVTEMLEEGMANVIGGMTGHGWYSGKLFVGGKNRYGTGSKLMCQLEIEYGNGSREVISTDSTWMVNGDGPIRDDDFQIGEVYNALKEIDGWSTSEYTLSNAWYPAEESSYGGSVVAQMGPTVKAIEEITPVSVTETEQGSYLVNLGQNISGFVRLSVEGEAGTMVKMRHGEILDSDGTLYTENLRGATSVDYYVLKGTPGGEEYQPRFTFHGFQYVEVIGYPGILTKDDITGIALSSLQEQTGTFETSNDMINKLQNNIVWGQLDNFISVPTDCPQRDERLGYTGDGQVFIRTASMNMDINQFFKKFMADVTTNQRSDGRIADWTPNFTGSGDTNGSFGNSGWGDAVVIMPWTIYTTYGDTSTITDNYAAMTKWVDWYISQGAGQYIIETTEYSDWLNADAETSKTYMSTAYFAYCADLISRMAKVIGRDDDAEKYRQLFEDIRDAFNEEFFDEEGRIVSYLDQSEINNGNRTVRHATQTGYAVALKFDLLKTQKDRETAARYLVEDIEARNWHLTTGFIGVAYLCPMLTEMGYEEVAYRLVLQDTFPSWLYHVKYGATTIWERWNSYDGETGQFNTPIMNSFNHYSLGSVGEWFYNYAAGIMYDAENPGYKHFYINPYPGGGLSYINSTFQSVYGEIVSNWKFTEKNRFTLEAQVPANSTATIYIPTDDPESVMEGSTKAKDTQGLKFVDYADGKAIFEAGSGSYVFTADMQQKYLLSIKDAVGSKSLLSINGGEKQELPVNEMVKDGDVITLAVSPVNGVDYAFDCWSGDLKSQKPELTVTVSGNLNLTVHNAKIELENLALGKAASCKTNVDPNGSWSIRNLTDGVVVSAGDNNGYSSNPRGSGDFGDDPEWVVIDLEENTAFNYFKLYARSDRVNTEGTAANFPKDFILQVRKDNESEYETVGVYTDHTGYNNIPSAFRLDEVQEARYIRLMVSKVSDPVTGEGASYLQLAEMSIHHLEEENAALKELKDLIEYAEKLNEEDYKSWTWEVMQETLSKAKVVADKGTEASKEELGHAYRLLELGIRLLVEESKAVDKTLLKIMIDAAQEAIDSGEAANALEEVQKSFYIAFENAKNIYDKENPDKSEIMDAALELLEQLHRLGLKGTNKQYLQELYDLCSKIDLDSYQSGSEKEAFIKALKKAADVLADANATQKEIEDAYDTLLIAAKNLVPIETDKSQLLEAIKLAESYLAEGEWEKYVEAGKDNFLTALAKAKDVYDEEGVSQSQINQAAEDLLRAVTALRLKADKTLLAKSVQEAESIDESLYTEASVAAFRASYNLIRQEAVQVLRDESLSEDDQDIVEEMTQKVQIALQKLVFIKDGESDSTDQSDSNKQTEDTNGSTDSESESGQGTGKETDGETDTSSKGGKTGSKDGKEKVKTGDSVQIAGIFGLMLVSAAAIYLVIRKKKLQK